VNVLTTVPVKAKPFGGKIDTEFSFVVEWNVYFGTNLQLRMSKGALIYKERVRLSYRGSSLFK